MVSGVSNAHRKIRSGPHCSPLQSCLRGQDGYTRDSSITPRRLIGGIIDQARQSFGLSSVSFTQGRRLIVVIKATPSSEQVKSYTTSVIYVSDSGPSAYNPLTRSLW